MGKNAHLHIVLESEAFFKLKKEAQDNGIRLSELCRQKLTKNPQLECIKEMFQSALDNLIQNGKSKK